MARTETAFITGGSSGLGFETARQLAAKGWALGLLARDNQRLDQAAASLSEDFPQVNVELFCGDVLDSTRLSESLHQFTQKHGQLSAVVHAAGRMKAIGPIAMVDAQEMRLDMETSLLGAAYLAQAANPILEKNPSGGAFVAFVGPGHHQGLGFGSAYSCAQAGLVRLVENLALERSWPKSAGGMAGGKVVYFGLYPAVTPTGVMQHVLSTEVGRRWLPRFTEMFGEGKEVDPHVPAMMAAWLCEAKTEKLSGRVVGGMLDPDLMELRLGILSEGNKGQLRLVF